MFPLFMAAVGAAIMYKKKPVCSVCRGKFTWNEKCQLCGSVICGSCGVPQSLVFYKNTEIAPAGRICKKHEEDNDAHYQSFQAYVAGEKRILDAAAAIEAWPSTYKGKVPPPKLSEFLETEFEDTQEDAIWKLKILAARKGCTVITKREFSSRTEEDGNYKHKTWKARGLV